MVRFKNRYLAVEIAATDRPSHAPFMLKKKDIIWAVFREVEHMHGDFGAASIRHGLTAKYCNPYTKIALIRVQHGPHRLVASVLPLIRHISNTEVRISVLYTGGTMMKCYKFIKGYQMKKLQQYWSKMRTVADREKMKEALLRIHEGKGGTSSHGGT